MPSKAGSTLERSSAREDQAAEASTSDAAEVVRCQSRIAWVRSVGGLAGADTLPGGRAHR